MGYYDNYSSYSDDYYKRMRAEQQDSKEQSYQESLNKKGAEEIAKGKKFYEKPANFVWIKDYENYYAISEEGDVWSASTGEFLHQSTDTKGYLFVALYKDGVRKYKRTHIAVAEAYVPMPAELKDYEGRVVVDHVDGDKTHCYATNLEWVTQAENTRRAYANGLANSAVSTPVICVESGQYYISARNAAKAAGVTRTAITQACNRGTCCKGKHWRYATETEKAAHS